MIEVIEQVGQLIWTLDSSLLSCVRTTLVCSLTATAAGVLVGVPLAVLLGRKQFLGRKVLLVAAHTGMAVPTVVIGLGFYALLSSSGPLGSLGVLYSRKAIIIGESALALPIIVALFSSATAALSPKLEMTSRTLGAGRLRTFWMVICEAKVGLIAATMAAFGRVCSELGIAMMIGGNIKHHTRTMTTAIAVETAGGEFALALALGLILLLIALGINVSAQVFRQSSPRRYSDVL